MTTVYKLTDRAGYTRRGCPNETLWEPGWIYSAAGEPGQPLCSDGWLHAYEDLLVGVFLNPIHAKCQGPRAMECRGTIGLRDGQMKCGCRTLEAVRWVKCPVVTTEQRVRFAIGCAWMLDDSAVWRHWATQWLSGADRSSAAAWEAAWAARDTWAAWAAAWAAGGAASAARATRAWAWAAAWAAGEAASAASEAARAGVDLPRIAAWAMADSVVPPERPEQ